MWCHMSACVYIMQRCNNRCINQNPSIHPCMSDARVRNTHTHTHTLHCYCKSWCNTFPSSGQCFDLAIQWYYLLVASACCQQNHFLTQHFWAKWRCSDGCSSISKIHEVHFEVLHHEYINTCAHAGQTMINKPSPISQQLQQVAVVFTVPSHGCHL